MTHYFDYNATAPTRSEVIDAVTAVYGDALGNPSSMHAAGRRARRLVDEARETLATLLVVDPREIVFTSGATESNNLALAGCAAADARLSIRTSKL